MEKSSDKAGGSVYRIHQDESETCKKRSKRSKEENTNKRIKLTDEQVEMLELNFANDPHKLESERKNRIAFELGLNPRQVAVWFQNKRAGLKKKKLKEENLKLKEQLSEANKEIESLNKEIERLSQPLIVDGFDNSMAHLFGY